MRVPPQIGISSYLTNFGHKVTWVIWSDEARQVQPFLFNDVHVYVTSDNHYFPVSSLLGRILNKMPNTVTRMQYILKIFKEGNYDLIFVRDDIFDGLVAAYIKRRYKVPFVFELSNPLEQDWEFHKIEPKKPWVLYYVIAKFTKFVANYLLYEADLILPTTKWFEEDLAKQGVPKSKMMPYPNGINIRAFQNKDGKNIRKRYCLNNSKVVIYIGTLSKARYLDLLIKAFSSVKNDVANVKLLIVGDGSDEVNLKSIAHKLGIENDIIFTGQVPQSEIPNFIEAADIGISPVPPLSFYKLSSPIKMFEYMAMGIPVVANEEIPEHKEVLEQSRGGILVSFTPETFADAIIDLLNNPVNAAEMGQMGREWVMKNRSYDVLARRLEAKYLGLL